MRTDKEIVESLFNNLCDSEHAENFFKTWMFDSHSDIYIDFNDNDSPLELCAFIEKASSEHSENLKKNTKINLVEEWLAICYIDSTDDLRQADADKLSKVILELKGAIETLENIQKQLIK
jgi:hypothetical protein